MSIPRLMISAPAKSGGKTTLTLGLARALSEAGERVRCFKKGPDYIDPLWHKLASGMDSYNLDPWMMERSVILSSFKRRSQGIDYTLIEGNHGLHDGLDLEGNFSTAGLAGLLKCPVLLSINGAGMNRGVAALVLGQMMMKPKVNLGGVVLSRVRSPRQESKMIQAIEHHTGVPVLGVLPDDPKMAVTERHLGLVPVSEDPKAEQRVAKAASLVNKNLDLQKIRILAQSAPALSLPNLQPKKKATGPRLPVGVIRDQAFTFYYPENLEALEDSGAELIFLDALKDQTIPPLAGLYIGGGFPESFLPELSANTSFKTELKNRLTAGLPCWAECGGLIYLAERAYFEGQEADLVGFLAGEISFYKKPVGYGYLEMEPFDKNFWLQGPIKGHEFHYSKLDPAPKGLFKLKRGVGLGASQDGMQIKNCFAGYTHLHALAVPDWAPGFMNFIRSQA